MLPRRLHPNIVTFVGFLPMASSYGFAWYASPNMDIPTPRWLCFYMAFSLFLYQTLDALDGKQARRIGQCTPLGQLFDHGVDFMACLSHHSTANAVFLTGASSWTLGGLAVLQTSFFLAQWQEHYTGVLYTSFGPVGVTETQYALMALASFAGILGPDRLNALMKSPMVGEAMNLGETCVFAWIVFNFILMGICFFVTMTHKSKPHAPGAWVAPSIMKNHETLYRPRAMLDLAPIVFLNIVLMLGWHSDVVTGSARALCLSVGLLFFYLTAQMIVFSMACTHFPLFQPMLLPFAALAFASQWAYLPFEMTLVKLTLVVHTIVLFFYVLAWLLTVINEIKGHMGIAIFYVVDKKS
jgi:phosphatidylglycerophosphate synthase